MRLLFVVQRYGSEVAGGAEAFCREYARRLVACGIEVEVVTSCATSYVDWSDVYPPGIALIDGVRVHRLPVVAPREDRLFGPLHQRVLGSDGPRPHYLQREWLTLEGPRLAGFEDWLGDAAVSFDATVFFTYLYWPTWAGLPIAAGRTTTVLHPTAHDEPPLYLPLFDLMFRQPHGFGFLAEEEQALVSRRFRLRRPSVVTGIGLDWDVPDDGAAFRRQFGLDDEPYLLYSGRLDPHKGADELYDYFVAYKQRNPGPLKLVMMGDPVRPVPPHDDVVVTGFVDEDTKHNGFAGALAFVQPSYFESFSIVLTEAWLHRKPALVQARCDVLRGQAARSGGGIPYTGFAEFEAAVDLVTTDDALAERLGRAGRRYVEDRYQWDHVLDTYVRFLERLVEHRTASAVVGTRASRR